jgi:hypothetical protein
MVRQDKARQGKTRQDKTRQDKTRQGKTRQDKTRQDKTRQDKTRQDKTRQDRTRPDQTRPDQTRQTRPDQTREKRRGEERKPIPSPQQSAQAHIATQGGQHTTHKTKQRRGTCLIKTHKSIDCALLYELTSYTRGLRAETHFISTHTSAK